MERNRGCVLLIVFLRGFKLYFEVVMSRPAFDAVHPVVGASRAERVPFFWGILDAVRPIDPLQSRLFHDASRARNYGDMIRIA